MRVVTWNVNSIRARLPRVLDWFDTHQPDVALLQETKCHDEQFDGPATEFRSRGYETAHHGVDHRNGVAVVSRIGPDDVQTGFTGLNRPPYDEPRLVAATCNRIRFLDLDH